MDVLTIGSITIFTNISDRQRYLFDDQLNEKVSRALVNWFEKELNDRLPEQNVIIVGYRTEVGCIITPIIFGIVLKVVAAAGPLTAGLTLATVGGCTYKVITDYDKIKKNLKLISEDVKGLWLRITHRKKNEQPKEDPAIDTQIEIYKELPDDLKKQFTSGQDTVIISEKEVLTTHKICIMRGDIKEEITKETYEKEIRKIEGKQEPK